MKVMFVFCHLLLLSYVNFLLIVFAELMRVNSWKFT